MLSIIVPAGGILAFFGLMGATMAGVLTLAMATANFVLWYMQWRIEWIPIVQKAALVAFLAWVSSAIFILWRSICSAKSSSSQ